jgi:hypothetical protein
MIGSPPSRGAVASTTRAAASAGDAVVSAVSAAMAASATMAGGPHRRIASACPPARPRLFRKLWTGSSSPSRNARRWKPGGRTRMDCAVANRFVMPCPDTIHGRLPEGNHDGLESTNNCERVDGSRFTACGQTLLGELPGVGRQPTPASALPTVYAGHASGCGPLRRSASVRRDACNGRRSGRSAGASAPPHLTQSRRLDVWPHLRFGRP